MFVHIFLRENSDQKVADLSTFSASLEEEAVRSLQRDSTAIHSAAAAARYMRPLAYHSSGNVTSQEYYDVIVATTAHTHTHPFNGPLSRTTRVGRYQKGKTNLDFTEARDSELQ